MLPMTFYFFDTCIYSVKGSFWHSFFFSCYLFFLASFSFKGFLCVLSFDTSFFLHCHVVLTTKFCISRVGNNWPQFFTLNGFLNLFSISSFFALLLEFVGWLVKLDCYFFLTICSWCCCWFLEQLNFNCNKFPFVNFPRGFSLPYN